MAKMKLRAKMKGDDVQVKALMNHPMETGRRKDKKGELIPEHFIKQVKVAQGDKQFLTAQWGPGISKNPYMSVMIKGPKSGDTITVTWEDNMGESESADVTIA